MKSQTRPEPEKDPADDLWKEELRLPLSDKQPYDPIERDREAPGV